MEEGGEWLVRKCFQTIFRDVLKMVGGDWLDWEFEGHEHVCATNGKLIIISKTCARVSVCQY